MHTKEVFVLIHGAWHGAWAYYQLKARLEERGHRVITFDLPALGKDRTAPGTVTLAHHTATVVAVLDSLEAPAIVVGHSYGGVVLSTVCEARPAKIKKAVYLTAFLLQDGQSLLDVAGADPDSKVMQNAVLNGMPPVDGIIQVKETAFVAAFYEDCAADIRGLAQVLLVPHPFATFSTPVHLGERYRQVSKVYISCLEDQAITLASQRAMCAAQPEVAVREMKTSHSPFFSQPDQLAAMLEEIAGA